MRKHILALFVLLSACATPVVPGDPIDPSAVEPLNETVLVFENSDHHCSSVLIEPNIAVTAAHCVIVFAGSGWVRVSADTVVVVDRAWVSEVDDIALIHLIAAPTNPTAQISTDLPHYNDVGLIMGYGCDSTRGRYVLGARRILYRGRDMDGTFLFVGAVCHGDSGGAVFTEDDRLLGVTSWGREQSTEMGIEPIAGALDGLLIPPEQWPPMEAYALDD